MGSASAYSAVLRSIDTDAAELITRYPDMFNFTNPDGAVSRSATSRLQVLSPLPAGARSTRNERDVPMLLGVRCE